MTNASNAARNEATDAAAEFAYDGESYTVEPSKSWDLAALEAFEDGHVAACVRLVLGAEQWKRFRAKPRTIGDLNDLFEAAQKAAGVDPN